MSASGDDIETGLRFINRGAAFGSVGRAVVSVFTGLVLFVGSSVIAFGNAIVDVYVGLLDAIGLAGNSSIRAFFIEPLTLVTGSFNRGEAALGTEPWSFLGPFLPFIGVGVVLGVLWMTLSFLDARNSDVVGLGVDLPDIVAGNDEDGNPDEGDG
jgi:hypothetical protein